jgi:hypothetical protein
MFIEDVTNVAIAADEVATIDSFDRFLPSAKDTNISVMLRSGKRTLVSNFQARRLAAGIKSMIPCEPGTVLLHIVDGDDGRKDVAPPIRCIAWGLTYFGDIVPITVSGPFDGCPDQEYAIRHPNGAVDYPEVESFANEQEFLLSLKRAG